MDTPRYEKIAQYINTHPLATLGTISLDGSPHGSIVFVCPDDHRPIVYFITKNQTTKYRNLIERPGVSLTIVSPEENNTLQASGKARVVDDGPTINMISERITKLHASAEEWLPPIAKLRAGEYAMIAIELTWARLAEYKGKRIGDEGIFTEISG